MIVTFNEWDKDNLPNPEKYHPGDKFDIERANGYFIYAVNFILCHEFAHIEKGHFNKLKLGENSIRHKLEFEKEADLRAMELVLSGVTINTKLSAEIGILLGLSSMLFFKPKSETSTHPATDERMNALINKIECSDSSDHWGIAALVFKLWDNQFIKNFEWPKEVNSFKELYYLIRSEIQKDKSTN